MKILKYLLLFIVFCTILSITYSYVLSPRIKIINFKNYDMKLFKGESNANTIEPSLEEVERMLNSVTTIRPQKSYSFSIRREYIFSGEKIDPIYLYAMLIQLMQYLQNIQMNFLLVIMDFVSTRLKFMMII